MFVYLIFASKCSCNSCTDINIFNSRVAFLEVYEHISHLMLKEI